MIFYTLDPYKNQLTRAGSNLEPMVTDPEARVRKMERRGAVAGIGTGLLVVGLLALYVLNALSFKEEPPEQQKEIITRPYQPLENYQPQQNTQRTVRL